MGVATLVEKGRKLDKPKKNAVIDCDIHNAMTSGNVWYDFLPKEWHDYHRQIGGRSRMGSAYPRAMKSAARHDSWPPSGPPGSDMDMLRVHVLDAWDMDYGILNPLIGVGSQQNLRYASAMAQAVNDWQVAAWLEPEPRLRASLIVPYEDGDLAAAEIDRMGDHPGFAQVLFVVRTMEPLGSRKYWKVYEAALRHDLPIGIHFGGSGAGPITGAGKPSHYIEDHGGMPTAFQAQVASFVYEGVFEVFPELKVVLIEGGFGWLAPLMWRLDSCYKKLKMEVPHLKRLPSEYIREHFWLSTQPMEEPSRPEYFFQMLEHLDMNDRLMFATDYPHWDFDAPDMALPTGLDADLKRNILAENARILYKLD
jgi:predicted TIM-barrel fold metal-dependent hydrolase